MGKIEGSLLPLRGKISPTFCVNCENPRRSIDSDMELADSLGLARKGRLFSMSSSPRSGRSSRCGLSEGSFTPPFTPPNGESNESEQGTRGFLRRRPSEHYLEVLGDYKGTRILPKISPSTCLPPLGRTRHDDHLQNAFNNDHECGVLEGNVSSRGNRNVLAHVVDQGMTQLLRISDVRKENIPLRHPTGKVLRKTNSLPVIRSCNTVLTCGEDKLNMSAFPNRITALANENDHVITAVEEDFVEQECDETEDVSNSESALETFDRICHWLKECENAKLQNGL